MTRKAGLLLALTSLAANRMAFACFPGPEASAMITANERTAHYYAWLCLTLAIWAGGLRLLREKLTKSGYVLLVSLLVLVASNSGWRYTGLRGNCGITEADFAEQNAVFVGVLLGWQLAMGARAVWRWRGERRRS